jgi:hypothetical protein
MVALLRTFALLHDLPQLWLRKLEILRDLWFSEMPLFVMLGCEVPEMPVSYLGRSRICHRNCGQFRLWMARVNIDPSHFNFFAGSSNIN